MNHLIDTIGLMAAVILPLFNIPLIMRIVKRKSSEDISLTWALGVWVCIVLMFPSGLKSTDFVWRTYNIVNVLFFTAVMATTLKYRKNGMDGRKED